MGHDGHDHDDLGFDHHHGAGQETPAGEELDFSMDGESRVLLTTAGVDIGSTTTQLTLCRIELHKVGSRFIVSSRDVFFQSDVLITPVRGTDLDEAALAAFFAAQYEQAGIEVGDIDSGVIILTGLALARRNSERVGNIFAAAEGRFLAVAAGDVTEATLGCRGAGIEALSRSTGSDIVHVDIGGGTTKLSLVVDGVIAATAAIDIGARLVTMDGDRRITGIEATAETLLAPSARLPLDGIAEETVLAGLADRMAEQVLAHAGIAPEIAPQPWLLRTPPLDTAARRDGGLKVTFAGGVSEYLYGRETRAFGDLGPLLAASISRQIVERQIDVLPSEAGIRATVVGASEFTSQVSGNTIHLTDPGLLPLRGLPMVRLPLSVAEELIDAARLRDSVAAAIRSRSELIGDQLALVLSWTGSATFARLDDSAAAIVAGVRAARQQGYPKALAVVCDADVARVLGRRLEAHLPPGTDLVTIDGVDGADGDFLDVGPYVPGTRSVPVVVKTLLFPQESRSQ
jgi:ethanolamine utilization protein EutA